MAVEITLNGKPEILESNLTVSDLLTKKNIRPEVVTIELNGTIIQRQNYTTTRLQTGDIVELVYFMGGGKYIKEQNILPRPIKRRLKTASTNDQLL